MAASQERRKVMNKIQRKRLLNVAKALRESKKPKAFTMDGFIHSPWDVVRGFDCGTPACALGHYASRRDLQKVLYIGKAQARPEVLMRLSGSSEICTINTDKILEHFGITYDESEELFGAVGCGHAKTAIQAAKYIERFVKRKMKEGKQ